MHLVGVAALLRRAWIIGCDVGRVKRARNRFLRFCVDVAVGMRLVLIVRVRKRLVVGKPVPAIVLGHLPAPAQHVHWHRRARRTEHALRRRLNDRVGVVVDVDAVAVVQVASVLPVVARLACRLVGVLPELVASLHALARVAVKNVRRVGAAVLVVGVRRSSKRWVVGYALCVDSARSDFAALQSVRAVD